MSFLIINKILDCFDQKYCLKRVNKMFFYVFYYDIFNTIVISLLILKVLNFMFNI